MQTRSEIVIAAPVGTIFALAAATERWPELLPHYRSVRVLARTGAARTVAMAAWRGPIPISWIAEQIDDPLEPAIRFHHVGGPTRGMDVVWRFEPACGRNAGHDRAPPEFRLSDRRRDGSVTMSSARFSSITLRKRRWLA